MPARTFITLQHAADLAECHYGTVKNKIGRGEIVAYLLPGRRGHYVDKAEALAVLTKRATYGAFGPDAVIHDLTSVVGADFEVVES